MKKGEKNGEVRAEARTDDRDLPPNVGALTLKELVRQIKPENRYAETDLGPDRGHERIKW